MMSECKKHLAKYDPKGEYTLDAIFSDYYNLRKMMKNFETGYDPEWTVITTRMADIVRQEEYREERIKYWKLENEK